jgi:tetratricopeptide (TPR) repeat protein
MSYINDALKKAQRERDGRYERFGGIIHPNPDEPGQSRKRRLAIGKAVMLIILIPAALLLAVYVLWEPSPAKKGNPLPRAAGNPIAQDAGALASAAVPAPQVEKTAVAGTGATETVPTATVKASGASAPGKEAPPSREAEARYREALSAQRKGDHKGAEALYERVLALESGHVRALNNLGVLYMEQKRRERAIALFNRAIILKKDYVDPYYNMACLYAQANEIDESLRYLKLAMSINGDVKNWVGKDADMKHVVASPAFKKLMEGQRN